ncbi:MAG: T9SS type A sorting domain-containing protein [Bacteroidia bacterium]|nr:T9SS type A sorting domain-containing protein [Bacteroidia bacterium]
MKRLLYSIGILILASLTIVEFSNFMLHASGAPAGKTGSPGDGSNCTSCHGGTATAVTGWITSNVPVAGYIAGNSYTITVTVPGSGNKGFEVSPQSPSGNLLGTLTAGTGSHLTGSNKYITHSSTVSTNPAVWTFTWTAPASGTGNVTFYGAFAITTSTTRLSTLVISEQVLAPSITTNPISVSSLCTQTAFNVSFAKTGTFNSGNIFTAELSDAAGSFTSPISIGTLTGTNSGTIVAVIPAFTAAGTGYRIRVSSSNPVLVSSDNGSDLAIHQSPVINVSSGTVLCSGGTTTVNVTGSGGTSPYTGTGDFSVAAGDYNYTVTDANSCSAYQSITITQPTAISPSAQVTNASSVTASDGAIDLTVTGGTAPFTYLWSNSATSENISGLTHGSYIVSITDANNCTLIDTITVSYNFSISETGNMAFSRLSSYPNPFSRTTSINVCVAVTGQVELSICDIEGQKLEVLFSGVMKAGDNTFTFDATAYPNGLYLCKMISGNISETHVLNVVR